MIDPQAEARDISLTILTSVLQGNYPQAVLNAARLAALLEAYAVPPIEAPSLDPTDRAEVDAEIDEEIGKK